MRLQRGPQTGYRMPYSWMRRDRLRTNPAVLAQRRDHALSETTTVAAAAYSRPQAARSGQFIRHDVVRDAAPPAINITADFHFMTGLIALRYQTSLCARHFPY